MKTKFVETIINYDGSQLHPLYAYKSHQLHGDSTVAFAGSCNVTLEHMVDAEDLVVKAEIKSAKMLHFIVEMFGQNLMAAVALQRLLVTMVQQILLQKGHRLDRSGDDLYFNKKKLSVSIASVSAVSAMIHIGINIENQGTPVPTCALSDFDVPVKAFAEEVLKAFSSEYASIVEATQKVRPL